ncbi:MAG: iron-sulfur cluster assembly protein [Anaerolineae bacterium]|nr:iron-sulfur cluster assembly protein [Anaerolineae bacterium]
MSEQLPDLFAKEAELKEALRGVMDPELGMNVVELGLIREIDIEPGRANLTVIMTTPFCPYAPILIEQIRTVAQETLRVPTHIEFGTELWDPSMMEEGVGGDWGLF